ncbi:MAG: acyl--CoA ligase [Alphaproteobacteria bacterium]|nr:acyl--CoA ligase [Alphaproteobacteria bacterium]
MRREKVLAERVPPFDEIRRRIEREPLPRNLGALLDAASDAVPDRQVLHFIDSGETFTYRELRGAVNRLTNGLVSIGVAKGTHVGLMLPNVPEWPITWLAIARIGAVTVPVNTRYTGRELHHVLDDAEADYLVIHESFLPVLASVPRPLPRIEGRVVVVGTGTAEHRRWRDLVDGFGTGLDLADEPGPEDLLNIQYTSGTTGFPKGCLLSQRYWLQCARTHADQDGRAYSRLLAPTPFFYMTPQWLTLMAFLTRGTLHVAARQSASRFVDWLHRYRIDFCLFPAAAYKQPPRPIDRDNAIIRVSTYGFPKAAQADLEQRFDFVAREAFGMTEIGAGLFVPIAAADMTGSGSCGIAVPWRECRIADPEGNTVPTGAMGELLFRGPGMLKGYYRKPEATAAAFHGEWFRSGDLARMDARGYVTIVGRAKDMIRRAGENIAANEVEAVLASLDGIAEAAAVPVPDELRGEEVKVYVVLQQGFTRDALPPELILRHCTRNLASFKVPRYIEYRDAPLPRTASEKIAKPALVAEKDDLRKGSWDRVEGRWG